MDVVTCADDIRNLKVGGIKVSAIFSASYIDSLCDYADGLSVESCFQEMLAVTDRVAGGGERECSSLHGRLSTIVKDVDLYGPSAVINLSRAPEVKETFGKFSLECNVSVRDVVLCYAVAFVLGQAKGARITGRSNMVGVALVDDPSRSPLDTLHLLLGHWANVLGVAQSVPGLVCTCSVKSSVHLDTVVMEWLADPDEDFINHKEYKYELTRGTLVRHQMDCGRLRYDEYVYAVPETVLKDALVPAYYRWIHDKRVCCGSRCRCWQLGVRMVHDVGWLVGRQFVCQGGFVCGNSEWANKVLLQCGLGYVLRGDGKSWFVFDRDKVSSWLSSDAAQLWFDAVGLGLYCRSKDCVRTLVVMLVEWFNFIDRGRLAVVDLMRARRFVSAGQAAGRIWTAEGARKLLVSNECSCEGGH